MYRNMLKRDLKRKKIMNLILLLFTIMASMFVSSGLGNAVNIMSGTEKYFDLAGIGNYNVVTKNGDSGVKEILSNSSYVKDYKADDGYWFPVSSIKIGNKKILANAFESAVFFQKLYDDGGTFFKMDNSELYSVNCGEVYITESALKKTGAKPGDELSFEYGGLKKIYRIAGGMKDAFLGSEMMGSIRLVFNETDFAEFGKDKYNSCKGTVFYIDTANEEKLSVELSECTGIILTKNRSSIKKAYVMDMFVAVVVLVLSACLCVVSFVLLKFVILFTINDDFREIGVMKAIGIRNIKIRSLYMSKYFVIALAGGIIGFAAGIPFEKILIKVVSSKMVLKNNYGILFNITGSLTVIIVMSLSAFLCTGKVRKMSPVDAIRNGSTGERYVKKTKYLIRKSRFNNSFSMAVNDILSTPKRYITIIVSFFLCSLMVCGLTEITDTMKSDRLINKFVSRSDAYITSGTFRDAELFSNDGNKVLEERLEKIEDDLNSLGMSGNAMVEVMYKFKTEFNSQSYSLIYQQNKETNADEYVYTKGSAPQNENEIAITPQVSKQTGAKIGDVFTVNFGNEKRECMIVGYFQTLIQLGSIVRLHEDAPVDMKYASTIMGFQINFDDNPSPAETNRRIGILKEYYNTDDILNSAGYCANCIGVLDMLETVRKLLFIIACVVAALVTVLMEYSFISAESSQIAILKATGFKNSSIVKWQVNRFMIIVLISEFLTVVFTHPVTKLWADVIWSIMGTSDVDYYFDPVSLMLIYPGIILLITFVSAFLTAGVSGKIKCNEVRNVE